MSYEDYIDEDDPNDGLDDPNDGLDDPNQAPSCFPDYSRPYPGPPWGSGLYKREPELSQELLKALLASHQREIKTLKALHKTELELERAKLRK
jgi:hypothetical protein